MEEKKRERKVTPIGEAKWAHLHKPKAPYKDKGDPKYQIDVVFDPKTPEWNTWAKNLSEAVKKIGGKQSPLKKELDDNDEPTGRYYVTFKTSDKFKPSVFDKGGHLLQDVKIGNGSKVRVAYLENEYESFGGGINLYLNAVQVMELLEFQSMSASGYGFEIESSDEFPVDPENEPF